MGGLLRLLFRAVLVPLWLLGMIFGPVLRPVGRRLDSSLVLSRLLDQMSSSMATQRGLLLMVGTGLVVVSLVVHGAVLVVLVSGDGFGTRLYWLCFPFALLHLGVLVGFVGVMLATPLGQGYKDK